MNDITKPTELTNQFLKGITEEGLGQLAEILAEIVAEKAIAPEKTSYPYIYGSRISSDSQFNVGGRLICCGTRDEFKALIELAIEDIYVPDKLYVDFRMNGDYNLCNKVFPFRISFLYDMNQLTSYVCLDVLRTQGVGK